TFAAATTITSCMVTMTLGLSVNTHRARQAQRAAESARKQEARFRAQAEREGVKATDDLQIANEHMVKLNVAEGWRRVGEGDHFGALLPFAEAFALDKTDRSEAHQMRLASILQRCPKLVSVWNAGTNIRLEQARFSEDRTRLVTSGQAADQSPS